MPWFVVRLPQSWMEHCSSWSWCNPFHLNRPCEYHAPPSQNLEQQKSFKSMFVKLIKINTIQWGSTVDQYTLKRYTIAIDMMKIAHSIGFGCTTIEAAQKTHRYNFDGNFQCQLLWLVWKIPATFSPSWHHFRHHPRWFLVHRTMLFCLNRSEHHWFWSIFWIFQWLPPFQPQQHDPDELAMTADSTPFSLDWKTKLILNCVLNNDTSLLNLNQKPEFDDVNFFQG